MYSDITFIYFLFLITLMNRRLTGIPDFISRNGYHGHHEYYGHHEYHGHRGHHGYHHGHHLAQQKISGYP